VPRPEETVVHIPVETPAVARAKKNLLIVEDHKDIRLYLKVLFGKDYNIIMATNGQEGVDMAIKEQPDLILCDVMRKHGCKNMIFSSSATVYGDPAEIPITEKCPKGEITNPYGRTKGMLEQILTDLHTGDPEWNIMLLRYFNPIGAHKSGKIGEDPKGIPNNLVPYIAQVAVGKLDRLGVFGDDYNTPDGTGVRDYIHVVDLAIGHVKAIERMKKAKGVHIYNLGTGVGYSVLDVVKAYDAARRFRMKSNLAVPVILQHATVMLQKRRKSLDGWQNAELKRCVKIPGDGSLQIRMDTDHKAR